MARRTKAASPAKAACAALLSAALATHLAACGGGGGGGGGSSGGGGGAPARTFPAGVTDLAQGFTITAVAQGLEMPVKLAEAPDGRILYNELLSGRVRVIEASGALSPTPFATIAVETGGERGLLGLALSPGFAQDGHVYVLACVTQTSRQVLLRFTEQAGQGVNRTTVLDNLPVAAVHNGGGLAFLPDGTLLVGLGDANDAALAQTDGSLAGRVLRTTTAGAIPSDNPDPTSYEWCRGFRNPFGIAVNRSTGGVFLTENGPTANDELNYALPGKNYGWPSEPMGLPGTLVGVKLYGWADVIAPTGIAVHSGTGLGAAFANNLFIGAYVDAQVLRLPMSGALFTDVDDEQVFVAFDAAGTDQKPLDVIESADGSLLISTFTTLWRVSRE